MLNLSLEDTVAAMKSTNKLDSINIVLGSSTQLEEVLLTLTESFDFNDKMVRDIELIVKGEVSTLEFDFVKQVTKIKESRNGFNALMFCLKHFGFHRVGEAMPQLFDMKIDKYTETLNRLISFRTGKLINKSIKKSVEIIDRSLSTVLYQRMYIPIETSLRDEKEAVAVYTPTGQKSHKELYKILGLGFGELAKEVFSRSLDKWPSTSRGIYSGHIRMLRKKHDLDVKHDGVERIITVYH